MDDHAADSSSEATKQGLQLAENLDFLEDYVPSEDEPYMNPKQLEYFRQKLLAWREQLVKESGESLQRLKEGSMREVDALDQGTLETNNSLKIRTHDRCLALIGEIDDALERIEDGTYGYCEQTGEEIGIKRLEARPIATLSLEAQQWHERRRKRKARWDFACI